MLVNVKADNRKTGSIRRDGQREADVAQPEYSNASGTRLDPFDHFTSDLIHLAPFTGDAHSKNPLTAAITQSA